MSLLATASPWNSGNTKKRTSTMRKTIKKMAYDDNGSDDASVTNESFETAINGISMGPENTIEKSYVINESRNQRVQDMLSKMDAVNVDNVGSKLADFKPPPVPEITSFKKGDHFTPEITSPDELLPQNAMMPPIPSFFSQAPKRPMPVKSAGSSYSANDMGLSQYSNYSTTYDPSRLVNPLPNTNKPYYAKTSMDASDGDKVMEKLNYMIHLLEEQQSEKTNNVMEEFILYTFLGVFVIFMSDSFARAGKYTR